MRIKKILRLPISIPLEFFPVLDKFNELVPHDEQAKEFFVQNPGYMKAPNQLRSFVLRSLIAMYVSDNEYKLKEGANDKAN